MVRALPSLAAVLLAFSSAPATARCDDVLPSAQDGTGPRRAITAADLIELRDIGSREAPVYRRASPYAVSPDGGSIAFILSKADLAANSYCRALVVVPTAGGPPRVIDQGGDEILIDDVLRGLFMPTGGAAMVIPAWSPDGKQIGFLKRVDGRTQVWRVAAGGGAAEVVTSSPTDVERWGWLPDGDVVFATRSGVAAARTAIDDEARTGWLYDDRVVTANALRPQLREADVPLITLRVGGPTDEPRSATAAEVAVLPPDPIFADPADAVFTSPTGMRAGLDKNSTSPLSDLHIWTGDANARRACTFAACSGGIVRLWWADDGALLFLRREGWAKNETAIYHWLPGKGKPRRIVTGRGWLSGCTYAADRLFCSSETGTQPVRLVSIDPRSGAVRTIFDPNPGFSRLALGKVERLFTRNDIGLDAWADLVLPPDYKPGTRLPLVIVQYESKGFLRGGTGNDYPIFLLAARGFAVLSIEHPPTFGSNRPELDTWDKVITAMTRDWAERKSILSSLLAAVDQSVARGIVDPDRVGITGLSDGVSTVEYGLINTRRFAAAAISTCCEDPKTVMTYGGTAWADWNRKVRGYPLASEDGTAFWKKMSLAMNARTLDTPILMQLADREYLLALEGFTALREQKNPVEMYVYPDEYHVKWQPQHRLAVYERGVDWFDFWLTGREDRDPAKRLQYQRWEGMRAARPAVRSTAAPATLPN